MTNEHYAPEAAREACWCCSRLHAKRDPATDPWESRLDGYCGDCASARCDTSYSVCPARESLVASLRSNADLTERALDFMADPYQIEESKADIDLWRASADEIGRIRELEDAIHAAVSFTYIATEEARLRARVALKKAAGWPLTDGEEARLTQIEALRGR